MRGKPASTSSASPATARVWRPVFVVGKAISPVSVLMNAHRSASASPTRQPVINRKRIRAAAKGSLQDASAVPSAASSDTIRPALGAMKIADVTRADIERAVAPRAPVQRNRTLALCGNGARSIRIPSAVSRRRARNPAADVVCSAISVS